MRLLHNTAELRITNRAGEDVILTFNTQWNALRTAIGDALRTPCYLRRMKGYTIAGFYLVFFVATFFIARKARKSWYPRFAIEIACIDVFGIIGAIAYGSVVYLERNPNKGPISG